MRGVLGLRVDARHYGHVLRWILRRFFKVVIIALLRVPSLLISKDYLGFPVFDRM